MATSDSTEETAVTNGTMEIDAETPRQGITIRELGPQETGLAFKAMIALGRRIRTKSHMVDQINQIQRQEGYRLVASFEAGDTDAASIVGFRVLHNMAWGRFMYLDDVATREEYRGRGHGGALLDWCIAFARRQGCAEIHIDSAMHRADAHRLYVNKRFNIASHHFGQRLED
ncbi:MAG TPA: GNAT family N-acetyltransferase [Candidatus Dormibacteraeota bacterium]|jgi:GNAT superfamily N-acetyltransferase|nr:GNAT family N-acetyltransferase [Candidatus Dormibacteraeota bacterium]